MRHVAVDVVTGFLGSGKTTLLRAALTTGGLKGQRVALIVNEIGEIGIDGQVMTGLEAVERMVELSSGCICCSIDEYRFDLAIQEIVETARPDLIVIESTGLADPDPLAYRIRQAGLSLDAVITVADAVNVEGVLADAPVARAQIRAADFLVLSKLDLVAGGDAERVAARLHTLNPRALQVRSVGGHVDAEVLFATGVARYRDAAAAEGVHLARDAYGAFAYHGARALDRERFERFLEQLPAAVVRAKGLVRFVDRDWHCLFNVTCGRADLSWVKLASARLGSQAVFIGRDVERYRATVLAALARCEHE
jgi:cobalamin biosynthesis protein CobW